MRQNSPLPILLCCKEQETQFLQYRQHWHDDDDDDDDNDDDMMMGDVEGMLSTSWGQLRSSYKSRRPTTIAIPTIYLQISQFQISLFQISRIHIFHSLYDCSAVLLESIWYAK